MLCRKPPHLVCGGRPRLLSCVGVVVRSEQRGQVVAVVLEGGGRLSWVHRLQGPAVLQRLLPRLILRHQNQPLVVTQITMVDTTDIAAPYSLVDVFKRTVVTVVRIICKKKEKWGHLTGFTLQICASLFFLSFLLYVFAFISRDSRELAGNEERC